ncbi:MAG TPA: hypothetical protein VG735_07875 [Caulobacterales bacterium]|nr:hypothetical protein [Caulobacterales bacterium]
MKYGTARHRPDGEWVQFEALLKVAGVQYRKENVRQWAEAVRNAEAANAHYGVELSRNRWNWFDPNAIKVLGVASGQRWFIGYVPAPVARDITNELYKQNLPVSAELYSIYQSHDFYDVNILILAPPGQSRKARDNRHAGPR